MVTPLIVQEHVVSLIYGVAAQAAFAGETWMQEIAGAYPITRVSTLLRRLRFDEDLIDTVLGAIAAIGDTYEDLHTCSNVTAAALDEMLRRRGIRDGRPLDVSADHQPAGAVLVPDAAQPVPVCPRCCVPVAPAAVAATNGAGVADDVGVVSTGDGDEDPGLTRQHTTRALAHT